MIYDGHIDIWWHVYEKRCKSNESGVFTKYHSDFFDKADITGATFVYWQDNNESGIHSFNLMLDAAKDEINECGRLNIVKSYEDFESGLKSGKINVLSEIEGLTRIGEDISLLHKYYEDNAVRVASLTWNGANALAGGCSSEAELSKAGKACIHKAESIGITVDVSHLNERSFYGVCGTACKPFIASHSNAYALCPHKRNLKNEQIKLIAESGGLVGVNCYKNFVSSHEDGQTAEKLSEHVSYIADLVGVEHVAFGFDFMHFFEMDDYADFSHENENGFVKGLENAGTPTLLAEMKRKGFTDADVDKVCYNNYMNFWKKNL